MAKKEHNTFKVPLEIKELRGTDRKDRAAVEPVKFEPLRDNPEPPNFLGDIGKEEWHSILDGFKSIKIFSKLDLPTILVYCSSKDGIYTLSEKFASGEISQYITYPNGTRQISPEMITYQRHIDNLLKSGEKLGLTPVSRTKVSGLIGKPKEEDEFAKMFEKKKAQ